MKLEAKIIWFLSAALVSLAGTFAAFQEYPGTWGITVASIAAVAQGLIAWRAFVANPPKEG